MLLENKKFSPDLQTFRKGLLSQRNMTGLMCALVDQVGAVFGFTEPYSGQSRLFSGSFAHGKQS